MNNDTLIVIPIRMASSRLPGKPLIDINGKAMVAHVWEKAILSKCGDVIVACCDKEARDYLKKNKIPYVMTKKKLISGTDRVYSAMEALLKKNIYKYIINLQGDVPNISPKIIKKLALIIRQKSVAMATLVSKIKEPKFINDKNIVKAAITKHLKFNKAIYFSRAPVPYGSSEYFEHIGIYPYVLKKITSSKRYR